jgi:hypothetical protein
MKINTKFGLDTSAMPFLAMDSHRQKGPLRDFVSNSRQKSSTKWGINHEKRAPADPVDARREIAYAG